jgi:MFS family permease
VRIGPIHPPYRSLTIGMITLVSLVAFEAVAVGTAMPTVVRALDGLPLYALAFGGALAAGLVGMVVSGRWSDRTGPAAPTWVGVASFCAGLLIAGLAPYMWVLVVGRIIQGFGGGLVTVALYVVVGRTYPPQLHPRVFASFAGAWVVPSIAGPSLAGLIVQHAGWRWVFVGVVLLSAPAALLVRPGLRGLAAPHTGDQHAGAQDLTAQDLTAQDITAQDITAQDITAQPAESTAGEGRFGRTGLALGAAVSVGLLHFGGQQIGVNALLLIGCALVGLVVFTPRLLPRGTFAARQGLPSVILLRGLAGAAFIQADVFLPLMLSRERGFSPSAAGLTLTVGGLAWSVASWYQGRWGQRIEPARRLQIGLGMIAVGVASAAACVAPSVPVVVCVAGWALGGVGMGLSYPTMSALTLHLAPPGKQGESSSALQLSDSLFSTTVLAIGGTLFAAWVSSSVSAAYLAGYTIAEALALLGLLVAVRTRESAANEAAPDRLVSQASG